MAAAFAEDFELLEEPVLADFSLLLVLDSELVELESLLAEPLSFEELVLAEDEFRESVR